MKYQAEDTEDVTEQHVDLTARLANLQAEEARLRGRSSMPRRTCTDMLAIEAELNRVRQEIESMQAQVTYLERQAAMATVTIELTEEQPVVRPDGDDWGFKDAVTPGSGVRPTYSRSLIAFVIATAPLWVPGLIVFFIVRAIVKRRRAKRAQRRRPSRGAGRHRTIRRTSSVRLMPRLRMPLWAAVAIPAAAYAVRSLLRGNALPELAGRLSSSARSLVVLVPRRRLRLGRADRGDELTRRGGRERRRTKAPSGSSAEVDAADPAPRPPAHRSHPRA